MNSTKQKFYPSYILGLPNQDMVTAYGRLLEAVEESLSEMTDVNELLTNALSKVKGHMPILHKIIKRRRGHELTSLITDLHKQRMTLIRSIKGSIKVGLISLEPEVKAAANVVNNWFDLYSAVLPSGSQDSVTKSIQELEDYMGRKDSFDQYIRAVVPEKILDDFFAIHNRYTAAVAVRRQQWSDEDILKVDSVVAKRVAVKDLTTLLGLIDLTERWDDENYNKMRSALDWEFTRLRSLYLRARTMRQNNGESESVVEMHTASIASHTYGMNSDFEVPAGSGVADSVEAVDESVPESVAPDDNKEAI